MNSSFAIIGFDLGHGKTALARMFSGGNSEPEIVEIDNKTSITTAIAYDEKRGLFYLGDDAFYNPQAQAFYISFKYKPFDNANEGEYLTNFVKELYRKLQNSSQTKNDMNRTRFFIGHPSGWSPKEVNNYQSIIKSCFTTMSTKEEKEEVELVPESRAALIHSISTNKFNLKQIQKGILIIDIGSSTTDLTFISDNFSEDYGEKKYDLGASIIEKEILRECLEQDKSRNIINNNSDYLKRCELACRKAKETYFSSNFFKNHPDEEVMGNTLRLPNIDFTPKFNGQIIEKIINTELSALGNKSWKKAFEEQLNRAKQEIIKAKEFGGILLTGGGSKMNFVTEICHSVFPESEFPDLKIESDTDPELCIARGLARWGNISIIRTESQNKIKHYLDNKLQNVVEREFPNLLNLISQSLEENFIEQVLQPILRRTKYKNLANIDVQSEQEFKTWIDRSFKNEVVAPIKPSVKRILIEIEDEISRILHSFKIPVINIFEIPQLDTHRFQAMLNEFRLNHSIRTNPTVSISAIIVDMMLGIISGGLLFALPIPTPGIFTFISLGKNLKKKEKLITNEDISKIVKEFRAEGKFQQKIKDEINKQISPTNLTQSLRTEIDKTVNTKIEFIQMLLAAKNHVDN